MTSFRQQLQIIQEARGSISKMKCDICGAKPDRSDAEDYDMAKRAQQFGYAYTCKHCSQRKHIKDVENKKVM